MALVRDFEQGVVLVNPSQETVVFDLPRFVPHLLGAKLRRLKANPATYRESPHIQVMLAYNDGRAEDPSHIEVPGLDALFLEKVEAALPKRAP
jgi:hypothetical protein